MRDTLSRFMGGVADAPTARALRPPLEALVDRYSSQPLRTAGLVIKAGGGVLTKIGAADYYGVATGIPVTIAAATDMPSLTGIVISATFFNVVCFFVDSASVVTIAAGTQGATLGALAWPPFPKGKALVGFLIITHSATFTGGTTPLDTATTVYVSPVGPFDPSVLV